MLIVFFDAKPIDMIAGSGLRLCRSMQTIHWQSQVVQSGDLCLRTARRVHRVSSCGFGALAACCWTEAKRKLGGQFLGALAGSQGIITDVSIVGFDAVLYQNSHCCRDRHEAVPGNKSLLGLGAFSGHLVIGSHFYAGTGTIDTSCGSLAS